MSSIGVQVDALVKAKPAPSYSGALPESFSTTAKLQSVSSWNAFPVIPDTYARRVHINRGKVENKLDDELYFQ